MNLHGEVFVTSRSSPRSFILSSMNYSLGTASAESNVEQMSLKWQDFSFRILPAASAKQLRTPATFTGPKIDHLKRLRDFSSSKDSKILSSFSSVLHIPSTPMQSSSKLGNLPTVLFKLSTLLTDSHFEDFQVGKSLRQSDSEGECLPK
jgi:hypothetical protein